MEKQDEIHLNPPTENLASDKSESATCQPPPRTSKCVVYALLAAVLLSIAFLIFGLVVFRIRSPTLRLSTAAVDRMSNSTVTITAGIELSNSNFGRFVFPGGDAIMMYGNATVGTGSIYGGGVGSRGTRAMNVTLIVNYDNNSSSNSNSSIMKMRSFAELGGEVRVLEMMSRKRIALMNCTLDLNLINREIESLFCQ